ncbi:SDR family NAD(P)-dependent oxidoreductase [Leptospira biflexa]|uniref:SDR family NAD(P)-dependent oxidoreductase n=1 Tax=Leptospira biflexa TaxID=172 RepID=UPI001083BF7B|nr:SDR family NAD(P)-dependent oxidoreductase [Leptospira biflexa]TGM31724.1 SDR family oxidoreductase [Leptospira biflexa]TGM39117.1 SDR family oxidoreductase [Leptospira biflexa]
MELNLKNRRVLVTGASRGIGLAISRRFLAEGAKVAMIARTLETLETVENSFEDIFPKENIFKVACDVRDEKNLNKAVKDVISTFGGIDILIANVGDGRSVSEPLPDRVSFENTWRANFSTAENVVREVSPELTKSSGNIIFISSIAGLEAFGAPTDYSVAKAALIALSKNLARKLAPNIRVNCIAPGNVYFPGGSWDEKKQKDPDRIQRLIESTVPMKRFGSPDEIADLVLFLSSERASFITGSCVIIDGGQTVGFH